MEPLGCLQPIIIGVAPRQQSQQYNSSHIVADVILLDKSNSDVQPKIYQLREENHDPWQGGIFELSSGSFLLLGGCVLHNKKEKVLYYSSPNDEYFEEKSIRYHHLIIVKGIGPKLTNMDQIEEFCKGVQIMKEALELQQAVIPKLDVTSQLASLLKEQHPSIHFGKVEKEKNLSSAMNTLSKTHAPGIHRPAFSQYKRLFEII